MARRTLTVTGVVQGVGFRPHVYRLAVRLGVAGSVRNTPTGVVVVAQAPAPVLEELTRQIVTDPPPLADVRTVHADGPDEPDDPALTSFAIVASAAAVGPRATVPPDCAVCDDCLAELFDPDDRRYRHPFITCTNCGPRFTIITGVPYDRRKTSMAAFSMCPRCRAEYDDPADRRFHAQPVACPDCGPHLWTDDGSGVRTSDDETAIGLAQQVLADGGTVAVKGLGGYHLACRPEQEAVTRLRTRKNRPDKPFALMVADLAAAARLVELDEPTTALLADPSRPVVLVPRRDRMAVAAAADGAPDGGLVVAAGVAPGSPELGVMLAYTPLHHLLLRPGPSGAPVSDVLVMTSANLSDEPLCYRDDTDALLAMADLVLGHDRPIVTPCDDSVFRVVDDQPYPVRRSRGHTPLPVPVCRGVPASPGVCGPWTWPATFAVGAELKNTVCVLDGHEAVCSQHLGDMAGWESLQVLAATSAHVMDLYEVSPTRWAADAHPGYQTRAWALRFADVPLVEVQHHRAHVASLLADAQLFGTPLLAACFDGTGYGDDGAAWGGEWLFAAPDVIGRGQSAITRVGSLAPVAMVGGDQAVKEPWRLALAHLYHAGVPWSDDLPPVAHADPSARQLLTQVLDRWAPPGKAAPRSPEHRPVGVVPTTSMGRLFDAVASLLGVRHEITYEAQAAVELENLAASVLCPCRPGPRLAVDDPCDPSSWTGELTVADAGGWGTLRTPHYPGDQRRHVLDPTAVIRALVRGVRSGLNRGSLALGFHTWVCRAVVAAAREVRSQNGTTHVGLTGGVFANVLLVRQCTAVLREAGFEVVCHRLVPCNDGGLSLGQAVLAAAEDVTDAGRPQR